jgi:capsular polysaccharide biosynthesis protein
MESASSDGGSDASVAASVTTITKRGSVESELHQLMRVIRRRGWIIVSTMLVAGLAMLVAGLMQDKQYAASARVLVLPAEGARDSYNAMLTSQSLTETYRQMLESGPMFEKVIDTLDLDYTRKELDEVVTTEVLPDTLLIQVTVEDTSPEEAARIATAFVEQFERFVDDLQGSDAEGGGLAARVEVADPAAVPDDPFAPRIAFLVVLGLFGGLLLGVGLVVILEIVTAFRRAEGRMPMAGTST